MAARGMDQIGMQALAQEAASDGDAAEILVEPAGAAWASQVFRRRTAAGALMVAGCLAAAMLARGVGTSEAPAIRAASHEAITLAEDSSCSGRGEDCTKSKCCKDDGLQCYEKNAGWAQCLANCTKGIDVTGPDSSPWTCKEIGSRASGSIPPPCAENGKECSESLCCISTGYACYEKYEGLAFCKPSCMPGPDVTDPDDGGFYTCKQLGETTPGVADWVKKECAQPGDNCLDVGCCATPNQQCYEKEQGWGECKFSCVDPDEPWKGEGWSCKEVGMRTPKDKVNTWDEFRPVGKWVADTCAKSGEDCSETQCCAEEGHQCFVKDKKWSSCKAACTAGPDLWDANYDPWDCKTLGMRTPGYASGPTGKDPVAKWVKKKCAKDDADCTKSRCCAEAGSQCYAKNDEWATCMRVCEPGVHEYDEEGGEWSCEELGPRTPRPWGSPSLYCIAVIVINGVSSEPDLVKYQIHKDSGIAACDDFDIYSTAEPTFMGVGPTGKVTTIQFEPAEITTSKDGTAGNTELFIHLWESVRNDGRYASLDWTVKVDPDAVLLPDRLRLHLKEHTGKKAYIVNCNKPLLPEGPMMFGALEAFSKTAMDEYYENGDEVCIKGMFWKEWGEDWFMGHCLDALGVDGVHDYDIYSDGVCTGVDCSRGDVAAFHPFKDTGSWQECFNTAIGGGGGDEGGGEGGESWE